MLCEVYATIWCVLVLKREVHNAINLFYLLLSLLHKTKHFQHIDKEIAAILVLFLSLGCCRRGSGVGSRSTCRSTAHQCRGLNYPRQQKTHTQHKPQHGLQKDNRLAERHRRARGQSIDPRELRSKLVDGLGGTEARVAGSAVAHLDRGNGTQYLGEIRLGGTLHRQGSRIGLSGEKNGLQQRRGVTLGRIVRRVAQTSARRGSLVQEQHHCDGKERNRQVLRRRSHKVIRAGLYTQ